MVEVAYKRIIDKEKKIRDSVSHTLKRKIIANAMNVPSATRPKAIPMPWLIKLKRSSPFEYLGRGCCWRFSLISATVIWLIPWYHHSTKQTANKKPTLQCNKKGIKIVKVEFFFSVSCEWNGNILPILIKGLA